MQIIKDTLAEYGATLDDSGHLTPAQSEFRARLLREVKRLCGETGGTKRDLVGAKCINF